MLNPRYWLRYRSTENALIDYPLYDVPHKKAEVALKENQRQENYDYFMQVRAARLAAFQVWLQQKFSVSVPLDGTGVHALSRWIKNYGGALAGDDIYKKRILDEYTPRWEGMYSGYNTIFDISIFVGEYLIYRMPQLRWELYRGPKKGSGERFGSNMYRPHIGGFTGFWGHDPLETSYAMIVQARKAATIGHSPGEVAPDYLIRRCQQSLYFARIPEGAGPVVVGDTSNEPL